MFCKLGSERKNEERKVLKIIETRNYGSESKTYVPSDFINSVLSLMETVAMS